MKTNKKKNTGICRAFEATQRCKHGSKCKYKHVIKPMTNSMNNVKENVSYIENKGFNPYDLLLYGYIRNIHHLIMDGLDIFDQIPSEIIKLCRNYITFLF